VATIHANYANNIKLHSHASFVLFLDKISKLVLQSLSLSTGL